MARILDKFETLEKELDTSVIYIDEFKGDLNGKYQLVVYDKNRRLVRVCRDRKKETLEQLLQSYKPRIVVTDMFKPFKSTIKRILPNCHIVVDKFHLARQGQWLLRDVRIQAHDAFKEAGFKKNWKLIHKKPSSLDEKGRRIIAELKEKNDKFRLAYEAMSEFFELLDEADVGEFGQKLERLTEWLAGQAFVEFRRLGATLFAWKEEILNIVKFGVSNGFVEGYNNKIKVIKRVGYGYRNFDRFAKLLLMRLERA